MSEADLVRLAIFPVMLIGTLLIVRTGRYVAGRLLVLIGALHLSGLWVGRSAVVRMAREGFVNQAESAVGHIPARVDQELVFWFALWGIWTILLGELAIAIERRGAQLPSWFGWQLLVVNLGVALLMPKAGFWWVLFPAWLIIRGNGARTASVG